MGKREPIGTYTRYTTQCTVKFSIAKEIETMGSKKIERRRRKNTRNYTLEYTVCTIKFLWIFYHNILFKNHLITSSFSVGLDVLAAGPSEFDPQLP